MAASTVTAAPGPAVAGPRRFRWPLPALATWIAAWGLCRGLQHLFDVPAPWAVAAACVLGAALACAASTPWRRACMAAGFPLSWLLNSAFHPEALGALWWLLPLAGLCMLYPVHAWRDAPLFPTPPAALRGLAAQLRLAPDARIVDAGCGLGAGLRALAREFPQARLTGWEWSRPLAWLCAWRCRQAEVHRADIWRQDWSAFDLVYLFQRPESMPRAVAKASAELRPGAYLVSLEFEAQGLPLVARLEPVPGKPVWVYRR